MSNEEVDKIINNIYDRAKEEVAMNFFEAIDIIDETLGKGYAAKHPKLIGDYMKVHTKLLYFNLKQRNVDYEEIIKKR